MASVRQLAAQRGLRPPTNLVIPKGGPSPLPKVAGKFASVRNDHRSSRGGTFRSGKG